MSKTFYHELSIEDRKSLLGNMTIGEFKGKYKQPDWCGYPDSVLTKFGCWSLMGDKIFAEEDCFACECHIKDGTWDHSKFAIWEAPYHQLYIYTGMLWVRAVDIVTAPDDVCYHKDRNELYRRLKKHRLANPVRFNPIINLDLNDIQYLNNVPKHLKFTVTLQNGKMTRLSSIDRVTDDTLFIESENGIMDIEISSIRRITSYPPT